MNTLVADLLAKVGALFLSQDNTFASRFLRGSGIVTILCGMIAIQTWRIRRKFLPGVPGDLGLPWVGNLFEFLNEGPSSFFTRRHRKYGDYFKVVLMGEQYICLRSPELLEQTLGSNNHEAFISSPFPSLNKIMEYSIAGMNHDLHKNTKRILARVLGPVPIRSYFGNVTPILMGRLKEWEQACQGGKVINIFPLIQQSMIEANSALFLGPNAVHRENLPSLHRDLVEMGNGLIQAPLDIPGTPFSMALRSRDRLHERIRKAAEAITDATAHKSAIGYFVQALRDEKNKTLEFEHLLGNVTLMFFGSQDTVVLGITTAMIEISRRPDVIKAIRSEWGAVDCAPDPSVLLNVTSDELLKKVVTKAAFQEAVRFRAPAAVTVRQTVAPLTLTARDGHVIEVPAGMRIHLSLDAQHKLCTEIKDPEKYEPSRFYGESASVMANPKSFAFCSFGGGYRSCPGRVLAEVTGTYWVALLFVMYDITVHGDIEFEDGLGLRPLKDEVKVSVVARKPCQSPSCAF